MYALLSLYSFRARLAPALLAVLPVALVWVCTFAEVTPKLSTWVPVGATCGIGLLLASFAHRAGRRVEPRLYSLWGGEPAVSRLRLTNSANNPHELDRRHTRLSQLVPSAPRPTLDSESKDPVGADQVYKAWLGWLRGMVRDDHKRFPMVYQATTDYGFRRNLYGLRSTGALLSGAATLTCAYLALGRHACQSPLEITCAALNAALLAAWIFLIRPSWVKDAADNYAARLLETTDKLEN